MNYSFKMYASSADAPANNDLMNSPFKMYASSSHAPERMLRLTIPIFYIHLNRLQDGRKSDGGVRKEKTQIMTTDIITLRGAIARQCTAKFLSMAEVEKAIEKCAK
jgi:hypothetical protein